MAHRDCHRIAPRAGRAAAPLIAALALLLCGTAALAANPTPVQLFYVPFPESQLLQGLVAIENGGAGSTPTNPMQTYISIAAIANNTIVYYDQWENGYDPDIANPLNLYNGGNPGGTQIWGNGNAADGAPPGIPGDIINAGTVIVLSNAVTTTDPPTTIKFDGRDKIAATKTVALTHVGWAAGPETLLAGAVEVFDTDNWGTHHLVPVGQNIPDATDFQLFEYTSLAIMAGEGGATVDVDADADGVFETTGLVLSEGQSFFVNGGVNVGAEVVSDKPVQVDILTGDVASSYESRDSALLPTTLWTTSYYTPVSTPSTGVTGITGTDTTVWLYNPGAGNLTVAYTRRVAGVLTTTNLVVPGGLHGGHLKQLIPDGTGAHFAAGSDFYAFSTTDSNNSATSGGQYGNNQAWDWGYSLVPEDSLTPQVLIGLGIGRDPNSGASPGENGNPVWVTPIGNGDTPVDVYVDYDADPATGPNTDINGNKYNVVLSLKELERAKIFDLSDNNQTGMLVYTLEPGVKLAAAWGQDPGAASPGAPGLDVGTGVPPLPLFAAGKNGTLFTDNDGDGFISPGDVLLYTISIVNVSRAPVPNILLKDTLPAGTAYIPNTMTFTGGGANPPIPDDGSGTPFPLDGTGYLLNPVTALPVGGSYTVTFKVAIDTFANLPPGTSELLNVCSGTAVGTTVRCADLTPLNGCIGDFVWHDLDGDAVQDGGPEAGIPGVDLQLYKDVNGNGILDGPDTLVTTKTTNGLGGYLFTGVLAGNYIVDAVDGTVPGGYLLTTANDPTALTLAGGECRLDVDFGYRGPCLPGQECRPVNGPCDVEETCDAGGNCPADGFLSSTTVCRASAGVCDVEESCTGADAACPPDGFTASTTVCRSAAGVCDVAENCTGADAACPPDGFTASTTVCRSAAGVCDVAENCTGADAACPPDGFTASTTVCRSAAGVCDVAENCTGADAACPSDGFTSSTTVCRSTAGTCDVAENCTGTDAACPSDGFASAATVCRGSAGVCDVAETCTGGGPTCPPDQFQPSSLLCRAAVGVCDAAESCTGNAASCPPDGFEASTTTCRASAGQCDLAEACSGATSDCPPDGFAGNGSLCDDTDFCTLGDVCDGAGGCGSTTTVDCTDYNPDTTDPNLCTDDHCDSAGGGFLCVHENNGTCNGSCGNGTIDSGESCEPPDPTFDPLTGQVRCRPDCTRCGDGHTDTNDQETCDDGNLVSGCDPEHPQRKLDDCQNNCSPPICADPSRIAFGKTLDLFKFHGRLIADQSLDLVGHHFVIELQTEDRTLVFRSSLLGNSLQQMSAYSFRYKNRGAREAGGLASMKAKYSSKGYYVVTLSAYGQLDLAISDMTTRVFVGDSEWTLRGLWKRAGKGWSLTSKSPLLPPS